MQNNKKYFFIIAIIAISGATNCAVLFGHSDRLSLMIGLVPTQKIKVSPNPLELHGDSVIFTASVQLSTMMMKKKYNYTVDFYYTTDDVNAITKKRRVKNTDYKVGSIFFEGNKYFDAIDEPLIQKRMSLPYQNTSKPGFLYFDGIANQEDSQKKKKYGLTHLISQSKLVQGIITTSRLVETPRKNEDSRDGLKAYEAIRSATSRDDGQYKKAYELLKNAPKTTTNKFNQGLAYLLEGKNFEEAKNAFEEAAKLNQQYAMNYYALAIVAARTDNAQELFTNLKKAVALQPKLKAKARKDVEFLKYWQQDTFLKLID